MVKVFKKFENQENGSVLLMLSSCDHKDPKSVEGLDFKNASEDDRKAFLDREERHIDNYLIKGKQVLTQSTALPSTTNISKLMLETQLISVKDTISLFSKSSFTSKPHKLWGYFLFFESNFLCNFR